MPSRRTLLRTVTVAASGTLAACQSFARGDDGYVQLKSITGVIEEDGQQRWEPIVRVTLSSPPGADSPRLSYLADEWADRFDEPSEPVVPDDRRDDLRRDYSEIRYVVGVCSPSWDEREDAVGCYNVSTTRENFNAVQVHDRARASSDGTYLTIHSTDGTWSFDSE
jgi:hypothetical protein